MKTDGIRKTRVGDAIRQEIASSIIHDVKDPRVHGLITVTRVAMTPDLKLARVYVSILDDKHDHAKILKGLKNATGFLKAKIGKVIKLRFIPDLQFILDTSLDYGDRIDHLLKESKK